LIEDHRAGDMICSECGLVVGDRVIDVGSEWRTFSNSDKGGEDRCRVGGPENDLLRSDLSTMIQQSPGGKYGIDGQTEYKNYNKMSGADRALKSAFMNISQMADKASLPGSIVDRANRLFKMVYEGKSLKGRSHDATSSACLYIACRQEGVPRTFKEIVAISTVNKKEIGRCFKLILKEHDTNVEIINSGDFMSRFCGQLELKREVQKAATYIAQKATDMDIVSGRSPISIAAAAIYMASQASEFKKSGNEIAVIAGVAESTIKQSYKLMLPRAFELFPSDFKFVTSVENLPRN